MRIMTPDETTTEEKSSRSYWGFVLWPSVVLVVYVLSVGPAHLAVERKLINWRLLYAYMPLDRTVDAVGLRKPYFMYLHLWCPDLFDKDGIIVSKT